MAVINPNRLIEEWIDDDVNIIFYNRIFNHEVAAGGYLIKNTEYSKNFLRLFSRYDSKVDRGMEQGSDNGVIQMAILESVKPNSTLEREKCLWIWKRVSSYDTLFVHEACARMALGGKLKWVGKVSILPKGESWVRDTWLTDSKWSQRDFMLHGWQMRRLDADCFASWVTPLSSHRFDLSICSTSLAGLNWKYKDTFMVSGVVIQQLLQPHIEQARQRYKDDLDKIADYS